MKSLLSLLFLLAVFKLKLLIAYEKSHFVIELRSSRIAFLVTIFSFFCNEKVMCNKFSFLSRINKVLFKQLVSGQCLNWNFGGRKIHINLIIIK